MSRHDKVLYSTMILAMVAIAFVNVGVMAFGFDPAAVIHVTQALSLLFIVTVVVAVAEAVKATTG